MHWPVEKKLFGKSLNLEYLATKNVFFATEQVWNNTRWNIWQQEMFFACEQVYNNLECLATRNVFC